MRTHLHVEHPPGTREGMTVGLWVAMQRMVLHGLAWQVSAGAAEAWRAIAATKATMRVRKAIVVINWAGWTEN